MDTGTLVSIAIGLIVLLLGGAGGAVAWLRRPRVPVVAPTPPASGAAVHANESRIEAEVVAEAKADRERAAAELQEVAKIPDPNERRKKLAEAARRR